LVIGVSGFDNAVGDDDEAVAFGNREAHGGEVGGGSHAESRSSSENRGTQRNDAG
jgi:hypothetical protein